VLAHRSKCRRVDFEFEIGRETHRPEKSKVIFRKTLIGIANAADSFRFKIRLPPNVIDKLVGNRVKEESVDREIASLCVMLCIGERDCRWMPTVLIFAVAAKRSDFDIVSLDRDKDDAKLRPDFLGSLE
jgi:hypothetical protein